MNSYRPLWRRRLARYHPHLHCHQSLSALWKFRRVTNRLFLALVLARITVLSVTPSSAPTWGSIRSGTIVIRCKEMHRNETSSGKVSLCHDAQASLYCCGWPVPAGSSRAPLWRRVLLLNGSNNRNNRKSNRSRIRLTPPNRLIRQSLPLRNLTRKSLPTLKIRARAQREKASWSRKPARSTTGFSR